jgi:hypothetical protein
MEDFFEYASMHQFITLMQQSFTQGDRVSILDCLGESHPNGSE